MRKIKELEEALDSTPVRHQHADLASGKVATCGQVLTTSPPAYAEYIKHDWYLASNMVLSPLSLFPGTRLCLKCWPNTVRPKGAR